MLDHPPCGYLLHLATAMAEASPGVLFHSVSPADLLGSSAAATNLSSASCDLLGLLTETLTTWILPVLQSQNWPSCKLVFFSLFLLTSF